jgi:Zn-dependent metalloprotease
MTNAAPVSCITPPHILERLLRSSDSVVREAAMDTLLTSVRLRTERQVRGSFAGLAAPAHGRRTVFDCKRSTFLSAAVLARSEDGGASADPTVNLAFDGLGLTRQFYLEVMLRDSIDDRGMRLDGYVHRGVRFNNAFWDGREMVFGDGDGRIFTDFTRSLDVIAHELTHGVTEHTAGLEYHNQSGALNESLSDVMGSLVKQWSRQQSVEEADWLIGAEVFTPGIEADALRSMKAPGTAFDNELFGKDPQPGHMRDYVQLPDTEKGDNGGVHINSGIPNRAFYCAAVGIGGPAWAAAGHIWYEALRASTPTTEFQEFAETTYAKAGELFGAASAEQTAVQSAWDEVGITVTSEPRADRVRREPVPAVGDGSMAELVQEVGGILRQVEALADRLQGRSGTMR